jgi:hypothetical protein
MKKAALILALSWAVLSMPHVSESQEHEAVASVPFEYNMTQLWFARFAVSEAGWQSGSPFHETTHQHDMPAMATVLARRSSVGRVTIGIMRAYGSEVFNTSRRNRAYIPHLHLARWRPRGWGYPFPWAPKFRGRFREIYVFSGQILRGEVQASCTPDHWSGPSIRRRVLRRGWTLLDCGNSANDFWALPGRD